MKTIIEDLVGAMNGREETILPENTTIRFEIGDTSLSCQPTEDGLRIYKMNDRTIEDSRIMTIGASSNVLLVR